MNLKVAIVGGLVGFAAVCGIAAIKSESTYLSNYERAVEASVTVGTVCSGTVIDDPITSDGIQLTVLTAKHCTVGFPSGIVEVFTGEESALFNIAYVDEASDLILLQSDMPVEPWTTAVMTDVTPEWGEEVYNISHPAITFGEVLARGYMGEVLTEAPAPAYREFMGAGPYIIATPPTIGGSSGSGLYNDDFELFALLSGGNGEHTNVWTPANLPNDK